MVESWYCGWKYSRFVENVVRGECGSIGNAVRGECGSIGNVVVEMQFMKNVVREECGSWRMWFHRECCSWRIWYWWRLENMVGNAMRLRI